MTAPVLMQDPDLLIRAGGISRTRLWRWRKDGLVPKPTRIGGSNFTSVADFDAALLKLVTPQQSGVGA